MTETEEPSPETTEEKSTATLQVTEQSTKITETQPSQEQYVCSVCGESVVPVPVKTDRGIRYQCPKCKKFMKPLTQKDLEERGVEYKGLAPSTVEARKFIVAELLERLDTVYGIATKKVKPIAATVEDNPQIALNPTALYWHIKQLAGQANDYQLYLFISGLFNKLKEKGLLNQATPMPIMGMPMQQSEAYPFMFPPSQQQQTPFTPFATPYGTTPYDVTRQPRTEQFEEYSEKRVRARRREQMEEEEHKLRMAKLEAEIKAMSQPKEVSNVVTVVEPMRDDEGKILRDDKGNILFRKITGPNDQVRRSNVEDPEIQVLNKLEKYKSLFRSDLDETKIKTIIQETIPKEPEAKPLTEEDVKKAAKEAALNVVAVTGEKDTEERRHRELLDAIRRGEGSKVVEGYKTDTYRFMGQGMNKLADVVEKKEPIKVVIEGAKELLGSAPPEKIVEPEAKEGIFKRVKKEFVAEE